MRRFSLVLIGLALLILAVYYLLNLSEFRPGVVKKVESALHKPVWYHGASLSWKNGPAIRLDDFTVYSKDASGVEIKFDTVAVVPKPESLLKKKLELSSVTVTKSEAVLSRGKDGRFKLVSGVPPNRGEIPIRDFEVTLKNLSTGGLVPAPVKGSMAVLGTRRNVSFRGIWEPKAPHALENVHVEADLGKIDRRDLYAYHPRLEWLELLDWSGELTLDTEKLTPEVDHLFDTRTRIQLENGHVAFSRLKGALDSVSVDAEGGEDRIRSWKFSGRLAGARFLAEGTADDFIMGPRWNAKVALDAVELSSLLDPRVRGVPQVSGTVSIRMTADAEGKSPARLLKNFHAQGVMTFRHLKFSGVSLLAEVLRALPVTVSEGFLNPYLAQETDLVTGELPFIAGAQGAHFENFHFTSSEMEITGSAHVDAAGRVQAQAVVTPNPSVTRHILEEVPELAPSAGRDERFRIPFTASGSLRQLELSVG